jgi:hypothetical protein
VREVRADDPEVVDEPVEVVAELRDVRHHLVRVLLDLHAAQPERDHLEVRDERRRRHGEDAPLVRVLEDRTGLAARELVVDRLGRDVHEREVVRALLRADVLRRDRVHVVADVARERPLVQLPLVVALRSREALEVLERELRVDGDELADAHDRVDAHAAVERVLDGVGRTGAAGRAEVLQQELAEPAAWPSGGRSACSRRARSFARSSICVAAASTLPRRSWISVAVFDVDSSRRSTLRSRSARRRSTVSDSPASRRSTSASSAARAGWRTRCGGP